MFYFKVCEPVSSDTPDTSHQFPGRQGLGIELIVEDMAFCKIPKHTISNKIKSEHKIVEYMAYHKNLSHPNTNNIKP